MSLSDGYIYASDVNNLKADIKAELDRRNRYSFTNFNDNISASQNGSITASIWNNLINPLNTINSSTTNYSAVRQGIDYIRALIQLSIAKTTFAGCPYRDYHGTQSGCTSSCIGMCQSCIGTCTDTCDGCTGTCEGTCDGCEGTCEGTCDGCDGCSGCGGCDYTCWGGCAGCGGDCDSGCYGYCGGVCGGAGPL